MPAAVCSTSYPLSARSARNTSARITPRSSHTVVNDLLDESPTCLLCEKPIHVRKEEGESLDHAMDRHIASGCNSGLAEKVRKQRDAMNRCSFGKGKKSCSSAMFCKFECPDCHRSFCTKHRHSMDHRCKGKADASAAVKTQAKGGLLAGVMSAAGSLLTAKA